MSLTKPLTQKLRSEISANPFYRICCVKDKDCKGRIQIHHNLIYGNKRINELFCLLPVCEEHHHREKEKVIGEKLDLIMWCRATPEQRKFYSKMQDIEFYLKRLKRKYGGKHHLTL